MRQEFLQNGLIIGSTFNLCYSHCDKSTQLETLNKFHKSLENIKEYLNSRDLRQYLKGDKIQKTFQVR